MEWIEFTPEIKERGLMLFLDNEKRIITGVLHKNSIDELFIHFGRLYLSTRHITHYMGSITSVPKKI